MAEEKSEETRADEETPEYTHYVLLSNGQVIDSYGAIPTHVVFKDNKTHRVVAAYER